MGNVFSRLHIKPHHGKSRSRNPLFPLDQQVAAANHKRRQLRRLEHTWEPTIRKVLARLAAAKWQQPAHRRVFPLSSTRIRRTVEPETITWWVEHDIPPYDIYRCAAYFVELQLDDQRNPVITARSGRQAHRLEQPTPASLAKLAASLVDEPPLIIPRRMGAALD